MGATYSVFNSDVGVNKSIHLKKLPDAIEESLYVHEKFLLIIDPSEQASRFLKYQSGSFINMNDPIPVTKMQLNRSLVGAMQYGRTLTLKFSTLENIDESALFDENLFPREIISKSFFFNHNVWSKVIRPELGDVNVDEFSLSPEFAFIICTISGTNIPAPLNLVMHTIEVEDKSQQSAEQQASGEGKLNADDPLEQIAAMYGASEIKRNSTDLVDAAFDGDLDELKNWLDKGYHIESCDGRKHTALSEASCQGQLHVVEYLLQQGADPNSQSDTGRSPLWRAAFNGHVSVVTVLLDAGSNPVFRDRVSMENAFDVAQNAEVRSMLGSWDLKKTESLMEARKRMIQRKIEERITTSAERELFARAKIRAELVEKAEAGDVDGIKQMLTMIAEEADMTSSKPRASAECRNDLGQTLLSIAAHLDHEDLANFLLTYWKSQGDLEGGELSTLAKVCKTNPNSRDLKGWNCVCIAVFQESKKVLKLLLDHNGDPNIKSSYNKNAWDLAKDELDAAGKVVRSRSEIRQVLIDNTPALSSASASLMTDKADSITTCCNKSVNTAPKEKKKKNEKDKTSNPKKK